MRIGTWNIGEDERNKDGILDIASYDYIVNMIKNEKLDVICLQEAITSSKELPIIEKYIKGNTGLKYAAHLELSISHVDKNNSIGVVICSKYELKNTENLMFDNPNVTYYNKEKGKTYRPADKGMIVTDIDDVRIVTGHGIPFYAFHIAKNVRGQYCKKVEDDILLKCRDKKWLLLGDLNEEDIKVVFPKINKITKELVKKATYKDKIYDHILVSDSLSSSNAKIVETCFDHRMCIVDI